ncbi:MAG: hypothetical protein R3B95_07635 [Nitrospirales bacterium]|nr:hypothetical protein [Nitrospirales bacterium]
MVASLRQSMTADVNVPTAVEILSTLADALLPEMACGKRAHLRLFSLRERGFNLGRFNQEVHHGSPHLPHAIDIAQIRHAITFHKPGGKLVAMCANGPRHLEALKPLGELLGRLLRTITLSR